MDIYQDFEEFIKLLNENKVEYLIIGGYAVSIYSRAKYTKDIDIWVNNNRRNAKKLLKVIKKFGFEKMELTIEDLIKEDTIIQLGYDPVRIDILTGLEGIKFNEANSRKFLKKIKENLELPYISLDDLLKNKRLSGRPQDKFDIWWLQKYSNSKKRK